MQRKPQETQVPVMVLSDPVSPRRPRSPIVTYAAEDETGFGMVLPRRAMMFTRITTNPNQMGGIPCIRGLRIPVATVVAMIADGMTEADILAAYPDLEREDIREALRYAADAVRERELPLAAP